jgi:hypothetical protein
MEDQKRIIKIPFDGKTSSFLSWKQKVWCYFCLHHCEHVLKKPVEHFFIPPDKVAESKTYDESKPDEKKKIDYLNNNSLAYSTLMLSQSDIVTLNKISSAKTVDLPNGYAWKASENNRALLAPSNHGTKNDLIHKFNHSTLHDARQPPDAWFSELDIICSELLI